MKISVIIPSTDAQKAKKTYRSIQLQANAKADEIIIVGRNLDDLVRVLGESVKIINNPTWINAATARNLGAKFAKGDALFFIDDDCIASTNWIELNIKALFGAQDIGAVLGRILGGSDRYFARCTDLSGFWVQQNATRRYVNSGYAASLGIRRDLFNRLGGFDPTKDMVEDCDLYARICSAGYKVLYEPQVVIYHNHGKDTLSKLISFMYEGGRNYRRYFMRGDYPLAPIVRMPLALISGFLNGLQSLRINKDVYPRQYLYIPGIFIGFFAWHFGLNSKPRIRENLDTLILFITGECNLSCAHCFYWRQLNKHDDISLNEIKAAFKSFGRINNLLLSGGEPFLRNDLFEVCQFFSQNNGIEFLSIPTNGSIPELIGQKVWEILDKLDINLTVGLSLDGMKGYHDALRGKEGSFENAIRTYQNLAAIKCKYPKLTITVNPVVTAHNTEEVIRLARFVKKDMPLVDHFWLCIVRGNPKSTQQIAPETKTLLEVYREIDEIFYKDRNDVISQRKIWDIIFRLKLNILEKKAQIVPCQAGESIGVLDSNGNVRACELRETFGNIKKQEFLNIWNAYLADLMRKSIKNRDCYCTHECFIYPSAIKSGSIRIMIIFLKMYELIRRYGRQSI